MQRFNPTMAFGLRRNSKFSDKTKTSFSLLRLQITRAPPWHFSPKIQSCLSKPCGRPITNPPTVELLTLCRCRLVAALYSTNLPSCTESHIGCPLTLTGRVVDRPNCHCTAHVPTDFLTPSAGTEWQTTTMPIGS
jgi:hypothetical protein